MNNGIAKAGISLKTQIQTLVDQQGWEGFTVERTYRSKTDADALTGANIFVMVSSADIADDQTFAGIEKTVTAKVGIVAHIDDLAISTIDALVNKTETLANELYKLKTWKDDDGNQYIVEDITINNIPQEDQLDDNYFVADLDFTIRIFSQYEE